MNVQKKPLIMKLIKKSMELSIYWAERSKKAFGKIHTKLYLE